jgi:hypothetical protein
MSFVYQKERFLTSMTMKRGISIGTKYYNSQDEDAVLFPVRDTLYTPHKIYLKIAGCLSSRSQNLLGRIGIDKLSSRHGRKNPV